MAEFYTKTQSDAQAAVIGQRIKTATNPATLATAIDAVPDRNFITDAERAKLAGLEGTKFLGLFSAVANIPTAGAVAGSYADVDDGSGDTQRYIWDVDDAAFVLSSGQSAGETSASVKTKYEANANTNAFTDADKAKLNGLNEAAGIADFTAALDAALA